MGAQVAETTGDVNLGGFWYLESELESKFEGQTFESNSEFLSCQDPGDDRVVGAKDDKQVVFADLAADREKVEQKGREHHWASALWVTK